MVTVHSNTTFGLAQMYRARRKEGDRARPELVGAPPHCVLNAFMVTLGSEVPGLRLLEGDALPLLGSP